MRDYLFTDDNGRRMAVADMSDVDLVAVLRDGFENAGPESTQAIQDRLEIEAIRRRLAL
jgi:hypothetical protein